MSWKLEPRTARVTDIIKAASALSNVSRDELWSTNRAGPISRVRQAVYYVAWLNGHSYANIGRRIGRDHSSVMYGVRVAVERAKRDLGYANFIWQINHQARQAEADAAIPEALLPLPKVLPAPPPRRCKPKNDFHAKVLDRDEAHNFHMSIARGSRMLADAIAQARAA